MAEWETFCVCVWKGMSCHSFLRAVRYGNIIIGVYIGGSGSTEPVCVRPARKAGPGWDQKLWCPSPALGNGTMCKAVSTGRFGDAEVVGVESIWSKCFITMNK